MEPTTIEKIVEIDKHIGKYRIDLYYYIFNKNCQFC
jgi:hypothetical protein